MIQFTQLETVVQGKTIQKYSDSAIFSIAIDSRKALANEGTLFIAIAGERHDAHNYLEELHARGVRNFIVEKITLQVYSLKESNVVQVESSVLALQLLAIHQRDKFNLPIVGITGSNGKTIIKEWLYQMLSKSRIVVKNPGSFNSQVGVPLSVWQIQRHHEIGIFEAGISKPGEMERLERIIQPTIGIFTNIGTAHDEGFKNLNEKIIEKLRLFTNVEVLIYCKDHAFIDQEVTKHNLSSFTWGHSVGADLQIDSLEGNRYYFTFNHNRETILLPFTDAASIENCFHCIALLLKLNFSINEIQEGVATLRAIPMRLELKEGINQCQIIDDTYNNDLAGLEISLQFLANQNQKVRKSVILSDILESGLDEDKLVKRIAALLQAHQIYRFIGIGNTFSKYKNSFPSTATCYVSTEQFISDFKIDELHNEIILIKGARSFAFEKIAMRLQRKVHGTIMQIDLQAMVNNLNFFKSLLKQDTKIMVMVKAFAYGSGSKEVANLLQYHRVDYLGVAYADEGIELRKNNIKLPIMVMNPSEASFEAITHYNLEPEIYSLKMLDALIRYLDGKACLIHLKLDTGMHRLGFEADDLLDLLRILRQNPKIKVASIFTHLAGADESEHDLFSMQQATTFIEWADSISKQLGYKPLYHILNSPGILRLPQLQMDMVRLGIGLYGVDPTNQKVELQPVATVKTIISQIKTVAKNETIGYSRKGKAHDNTKIATIAIGYADGFSRSFSKGMGKVLINGKLAPVIGNVCMDMTMVDVSGIDCREGDEAVIFGNDLPIQQLASWANTIPYEILTNISERVKRVFISDGM